MGLDRFMDMDEKKKKTKKITNRSSKTKLSTKKTTSVKPTKSTREIKPSKKSTHPQIIPSAEIMKESPQKDSITTYSFISMTFKCTKCKYKKNMRRPQSFTPSDKDLICPKCGAPLKKSRAK